MALLYIAFCLWSAKCVPNRQLLTFVSIPKKFSLEHGHIHQLKIWPSTVFYALLVTTLFKIALGQFSLLIGCLCLVIQVLGVPNPCTPQHSRPHLPQVSVWAFLLTELNPQCRAGSESKRALQTPVKSVRGTHVFRLVSKLINFKPCNGFCWCYLKCAEKKKRKKLHKNEYQPKFSSVTKYMCKTIFLQAENYSHHE